MATKTSLLKSPVGEIHYLAANTPTKSTDDRVQYSAVILFDNKKDAKWLSEISSINDAKVVTATTYRGKNAALKAKLETGKSKVEAKSNFKPHVYDKEGNELEEAPMFFADSTGTAQMIVQPYEGKKGGTINLVGVVIHNIETPESSGTDRATRLEQLRAMAKADV